MRKLCIVLLGFFVSSTVVIAQEDKADSGEPEKTCYEKYESVINLRGCEEVTDGWHNNVIVTFRSGVKAECYSGKAEVKDGKLESMWLKFQDGTFEQVIKKYRQSFKPSIVNGISRTMTTFEYEQVNVIFVDKIKPKKKEYVKPPDPLEGL